MSRSRWNCDLWAELACYLFWVGRGGMLRYNALAGLNIDSLHAETRFHDLSVGDLIERLSRWKAAITIAQKYAKVAPTN